MGYEGYSGYDATRRPPDATDTDNRPDEREQAREHLVTATRMYREMGMTYWPESAELELANPDRRGLAPI